MTLSWTFRSTSDLPNESLSSGVAPGNWTDVAAGAGVVVDGSDMVSFEIRTVYLTISNSDSFVNINNFENCRRKSF